MAGRCPLPWRVVGIWVGACMRPQPRLLRSAGTTGPGPRMLGVAAPASLRSVPPSVGMRLDLPACSGLLDSHTGSISLVSPPRGCLQAGGGLFAENIELTLKSRFQMK